jgi:uncharacterized protein YjaZ
MAAARILDGLGYTLGYHMVGSWSDDAGNVDAQLWINVPATAVIEAAVKAGLISHH